MFFMKAFFRRITKDFQQKELLPLKLLFFVHASTLFVLYPYLTIHMRELGINVEETAIMSAVTPVVAIIMPPLAGMVADRIGNFRILLAIFSALGGGASLLLLLVPVGRVTVTYPDHVIMDMGCSIPPGLGQDGFLELGLTGNEPCHYADSLRRGHAHQVNTTLEACGFVCQPDIGGQITPMSPALLSQTNDDQDISQRLLRARNYDVIISSSYPNNMTDTYSYQLTSDQMPAIDVDHDEDLRSNSLRKNNEFYRTAIRNLSENSYFFPTSGLFNLTCTLVSDSNYEAENRTEVRGSMLYQCKFGSGVGVEEGISGIQPSRKSYITSLFPLTLDVGNSTERLFLAPSLFNWTGTEYDKNRKNGNFNATCSDIYSQKDQRVSISVALRNPENNLEVDRIVQLSGCRTRCLVTIPRNETCTNLKIEEVHDMSLTFWSYLVVRVFIGMIGGTAFAMFEGAVIAILREQSADYGLQRIYATIGGMISSPLSGMLIDYASRGKGYTDFRPAFYLYAGLKIASGLLMLTINLEFKAPAKNVVSDVASVLKNIEIVALFIAIFILGTAWGYIESFLFWLLQDLGGSRSLMGITITVGGIAGIPLLVLSGPIIDRIGHANVLFIGFMFYSIRLVGYSLIYNPWLCLIFEAMESVTSSLSFTAAVTYAAKLSTTTTDSSIQGLLGGLYFGVGKGAGSLIGGYMMKAFGTRPTYRIFAVACAITGLVYFLFNKFYLRKRPQTEGNDIVKKKPQVTLAGDTVEIDLNAGQKEKELNNGTNSNNNANNNRTETFPINTTASKSYSSADKNLIAENNAKNTNPSTKYQNNNKEIDNKTSNKPNEPINELKECNVNLAYDDTSEDDDYATISEQDDEDVNSGKVQMTTKDEPSNNGKGEKQNGCSDVGKGSEKGNKDCEERSSAKENSAT